MVNQRLPVFVRVQKHTQNRSSTLRGRDKLLFSFLPNSVTFDHSKSVLTGIWDLEMSKLEIRVFTNINFW